jgi:hypothetical protein
MTLDQNVYDYHDIVPKPRELTWAERNLPTFLGVARSKGYFLAPAEPPMVRRNFPKEITVRMPTIVSDYSPEGRHPLYDFCDLVMAFADRVDFDAPKKITCLLDDLSFDRVTAVPFQGDDTLIGDVMYHTLALFRYAEAYFRGKEHYDLSSVGVSSGEGRGLVLKINRLSQ